MFEDENSIFSEVFIGDSEIDLENEESSVSAEDEGEDEYYDEEEDEKQPSLHSSIEGFPIGQSLSELDAQVQLNSIQIKLTGLDKIKEFKKLSDPIKNILQDYLSLQVFAGMLTTNNFLVYPMEQHLQLHAY